jgi:uncharacterized glyoxalase superfamily protein PhnB
MDDPWKRPVFIPALVYDDPPAAVAWLAEAFGFVLAMAIIGPDGDTANGHWEMTLGEGVIMVGGVWDGSLGTPRTAGFNTQTVHVHLEDGLDAHCEHARAAGATIVREPADEFYGDRVYAALDPWGHRWAFGQAVRRVSKAEAEAATGLKIEGWL